MSAAANDISAEGVKALYQEVIEKLIAISLVEEVPHISLLKSSPCPFLMGDDMPRVLLGHFVVCLSHTLKAFSTYGMMAKSLQWQQKPSTMQEAAGTIS